jgi:membrane protease YdiL (CAAX protease family)
MVTGGVRGGGTLGLGRLAVHGEHSGPHLGTRPIALVVGCYVGVGALATGLSVALGRNPLVCEGWLGARGPASWLLSLGLGVPLGAATIAVTRVIVRRSAWAHALHVALRPAAYGAGDGTLLVLAAASATGEELLFRGLLAPAIGVVASSLLFGALHQVRGPARWPWMAWAVLMGLLFASVFDATGNLVGPLFAHATINHANLRFLRDIDPSPRRKSLGGLLKR